MKIILLCNADILAIPAALYLHNQGMLAGVAVPDRSAAVLRFNFEQAHIPGYLIHSVSKKQLSHLLLQLVNETGAGVVAALTFPWLLPDDVLCIPDCACVNFHFGLLPVYKGADPVFWQLRNGEKEGGITVHVMTADIDSGPVLLRTPLPFIPGETYGIHCERLGHLAAVMMQQLLTMLPLATPSAAKHEETEALYFRAPDTPAQTIQWQQSAADIIHLVNACNPKYGGAATSFRSSPVRIIEVLPVEVNNPQENTLPGTIVHADNLYGLIVAAINKQYLRITVAQIREGYLSGSKLAQLGWMPGERFM